MTRIPDGSFHETALHVGIVQEREHSSNSSRVSAIFRTRRRLGDGLQSAKERKTPESLTPWQPGDRLPHHLMHDSPQTIEAQHRVPSLYRSSIFDHSTQQRLRRSMQAISFGLGKMEHPMTAARCFGMTFANEMAYKETAYAFNASGRTDKPWQDPYLRWHNSYEQASVHAYSKKSMKMEIAGQSCRCPPVATTSPGTGVPNIMVQNLIA